MPVLELTMEQEFKLKQVNMELQSMEKEDIISVFSDLQKQAYLLSNNLSHLLKHWP